MQFDIIWYTKRIRAYKQIGYEIYSGQENVKQKINAIYDYENYLSAYQKDLQEANRSIVISSPVISGLKIGQMISMMRAGQEKGVKITVVTRSPEDYGFGR